jgi:hypothetical protein
VIQTITAHKNRYKQQSGGGGGLWAESGFLEVILLSEIR